MDRDHDSSSSQEEEPEGDDLFADEVLAEDYASQSSGDKTNTEDNDFIDNADSDAFDDLSDAGRMHVNQMLEEREREYAELRKKVSRRKRLLADDDDDDDGYGDAEDEDHVEDDEAPRRRKLDENRRHIRVPTSTAVTSTRYGDDDDDESDDGGGGGGPPDGDYSDDDENGGDDDDDDDGFDWTVPRTELYDWVRNERVQTHIQKAIRHLLLHFTLNGQYIYRLRIQQLVRENRQTLELSFVHLCSVHDAVLGSWVADCPEEILPLFNKSASTVLQKMFPRYALQAPHVYVRMIGLTVKDSIRDLRSLQLRSLIHIDGVIVRRSPVFKKLLSVLFDCTVCNSHVGPLLQRGQKEVRPTACPRCQSKGPFRVNVVNTLFENHQTMILQEAPSSVPPGRLPRTMELILTNDLVDGAKPGDDVDVVGIFKHGYDPVLHNKQGFPVFSTTIEVNNIIQRHTELRSDLGDEEQQKIRDLASHPMIKEKLLRSVAPSVHGHTDVKLGLLLSLLGGVSKETSGHRTRGDINVLLLGDPGTGKSQFLKWVERTSHRAVFTTGKGSTAVGLTAAVHKDPTSGEYVLEGGAMVIADKGVCLIDEFDKMNDHDRTSIHEAMEQQTISVARAGIVTTLSARCTVIAAANPVTGRYDRSANLEENVQLTKPILSRFDLIFIICDEASAENDFMLAKFVTASHRKNHPAEVRAQRARMQEAQLRLHQSTDPTEIAELEQQTKGDIAYDDDPSSPNPFEQSLLTKYILYARTKCQPKIVHADPHKIPRLFADLRQESSTLTIRQLESVVRLAEAHARLFLREYVQEEDFNEAIALFLRCYMRQQRLGHQSHLYSKFSKYMMSDKGVVPLVVTKLQWLVKRELQVLRARDQKVPKEIRIPYNRLAEALSNDSVSLAALHGVLSKGSGSGGLPSNVSLQGDVIVYRVEGD